MKIPKRIHCMAVCASLVAFSGTTLAEKSIKIQMQVTNASGVKLEAAGFSVGNEKKGSLLMGGSRLVNKSGPAGQTYSFGLKTSEGTRVSCGHAVLTKDSIVKVTFNGTTCKITHIRKM